jgi:hypothetical protein
LEGKAETVRPLLQVSEAGGRPATISALANVQTGSVRKDAGMFSICIRAGFGIVIEHLGGCWVPERSAQRVLKVADQILKAGTGEEGVS